MFSFFGSPNSVAFKMQSGSMLNVHNTEAISPEAIGVFATYGATGQKAQASIDCVFGN